MSADRNTGGESEDWILLPPDEAASHPNLGPPPTQGSNGKQTEN